MILPAAPSWREAGYDGVEVMGSEGYLINEFLAARTNQRDDQWGGDYARRMRFAVEVVRAVRERAGSDFIIIYRLSMLDLVSGGSTLAEVTELAKAIEAAGATIINTGIGWHEARIPTIATPVPRGAFSWVTRKLKGAVSIPLVTTNRINDPAGGGRSCPRRRRYGIDGPPVPRRCEFLSKAQSGRADEINTCIGCNQACLDRIFAGKVTSCLVNPRACHETLMPIAPAPRRSGWRWSAPPCRAGLCR
jgi:2,4-dienoyl-CoA reductase (NADPH2)